MNNEQLEKYNSMIWDEWSKAVKKHPKFCDSMTGCPDAEIVERTVSRYKHINKKGPYYAERILFEEIYEALEAYLHDEPNNCLQELAQCGAVILRMMEFVDNEERTKKIPEPKTRRATWQQLAYWLIDGKGLAIDTETNRVDTGVFFSNENMHEEVGERWKVMKRGDSEWNEPTVDYMGLEEK